ncbi:MAG: class I SAM-dependent methyltransferase [Planctomycetota bacterium]
MTLLEHDKLAFDESHYDRKYFEGHIKRYEAQVYRQRVEHVGRFMGEVAGKEVLDLGCGVGYFGGQALVRGARRVTGLDFSAVALELCRGQQPRMGLLRGDATRLPFPDARFDVVLLNDIVEHLAEDLGRQMVAEVYRVLRPGGVLVVDTDNEAFLMHKKGFRRLNDWLEQDTPQRVALREIKKTYNAPTLHIKIYSATELRALLSGVGFRIEAFDTYPYIAVPSRDGFFNLPLLRGLFRGVKGDVQIFRARKPA